MAKGKSGGRISKEAVIHALDLIEDLISDLRKGLQSGTLDEDTQLYMGPPQGAAATCTLDGPAAAPPAAAKRKKRGR